MQISTSIYRAENPAVDAQWRTPGRTVLQFANFGSSVIDAALGKASLLHPSLLALRRQRLQWAGNGGHVFGDSLSSERRVVSGREIRQPFVP
jgi:hypothetical protein